MKNLVIKSEAKTLVREAGLILSAEACKVLSDKIREALGRGVVRARFNGRSIVDGIDI